MNNVVALARYQHAMGDVEGGLETALGTYNEWLQGGKDADWRWRNAVRELTQTFLPDHRDRFVAAIDEVAKGGESASLTSKRLDLFGIDTPPDEILAAKPWFIEKIGLQEHLSPTRSNGLHAMLGKIEAVAREAA